MFSYTGKRQLMMDEKICIDVIGREVKFKGCEVGGPKWEYDQKVVLRLILQYCAYH